MARVRAGSMLSKKSKIERLRKSREDQFFVVSATASLCRACTKVCDRFLCDSMWSLTLPRVGRTSGAKTFRSLARKDFFDSIGEYRKLMTVLLALRRTKDIQLTGSWSERQSGASICGPWNSLSPMFERRPLSTKVMGRALRSWSASGVRCWPLIIAQRLLDAI